MFEDRLLWASLGGAAVLVASGCTNDVMDASCTPDHPDLTISDDCPYQQSRGPQIPNPDCRVQQEMPATAPTWTDVFAIFIATDRGNCAATACHGDMDKAANGIFLPSDDEVTFYETLVNTTGSVGRKYVNPDSPLESWIHCNVAGTPGGGLIMPKPAGMPAKADALIVEDWVIAGARGPGG
jgi:hypothetical protein